MRSFAEHKIKGGKLVGIEMEYDNRIKDIKILGDFFIHPEESLYKIEKALIGLDANASREEITKAIKKIVAAEKAEMIGITPESIAETIEIAVKRCDGE
jgi:lipoate---protein ligase